MNKSNYINAVQNAIISSNNELDVIEAICELPLPLEPTPVEALIYGESKQIESIKEDQEEDYGEDPHDAAKIILSKIKSYINDFENSIQYKYRFQLLATYQHFIEESLDTEFIKIIRRIEAKSISQALAESKEWGKDLPNKLPLFSSEKRDCLFVSLKPVYEVIANKDGTICTISDGRIEFGDERDINTRTNNNI